MKSILTLVLPLALALASLLPAPAQTTSTNDYDAVTAAWPPNSEPDLGGYRLYFGQGSNVWTHVKTVAASAEPKATVLLSQPGPWYFVVTATNTAGLESEPSNMVTWTSPSPPGAPAIRLLSGVVSRTSTVTTTTNLIFVP